MKSIGQMSEYFDVGDQAIQRRLKRLREAGLIKPVYRVKMRNGKTITFDDSEASWNYRDQNKKGVIAHAFQIVLDDTFIVETRAKNRNRPKEDVKFDEDDDDEIDDEFYENNEY